VGAGVLGDGGRVRRAVGGQTAHPAQELHLLRPVTITSIRARSPEVFW